MRINSDSLQASRKQIVEGFSSQGEWKKLAEYLNPNHVTHCFQSERRTDEINLKTPPASLRTLQTTVPSERGMQEEDDFFLWTCKELDLDDQAHSTLATEQSSEGVDFWPLLFLLTGKIKPYVA